MSHNLHKCTCPRHTAIKIDNLSVTLNSVKILRNITAAVPRGVCTAIVGPNGAGKSTLVKAILNEISYSGTISFGQDDGSFGSHPPRWGYVPQKLNFDRAMPITALEFMIASQSRRPLFLGSSRKLQDKCLALLHEVEAPHTANRQLGKLSGGELQRILLATAILQEPQILVLDEVASGVDFQGEKLCCGLLEKFRRERKFTQLMISHDLATVAAHAAHVICLNHSLVAAGHPAEVLTEENLRAAFGMHARPPIIAAHKEICICSEQD